MVGRVKRRHSVRDRLSRVTAGHKTSRNESQFNEGRAFGFLEINRRAEKPRSIGLTEIRGPYYAPLGRRYLEDILETMGSYVDSLKFAGGSFSLMPRKRLWELIATAHKFQVSVSTGGFIEY